jgi:stringent starvation protein B
MVEDMISLKPYLIKAVHDWCCDNNVKPMLVVHAGDGTHLPVNLRYGDATTFDIGVKAIIDLKIDKIVSFRARFSGKVQEIMVPVGDVYAIYADGHDIGFTFDRYIEPKGVDGINTDGGPPKKRPTLTIVK